ncbi:MAG: hypothetical protein HGA45_25350 [Chloroflexales bacterium]|nr:hypothetical protein [Chloroflexales bacterium]
MPASHRPMLVAVLLSSLVLLVTMLLAGCGQSPAAASKNAPPPVPTTPPAAPVKATEPAIAPERLAAARELLVSKGCIGCHTVAVFPEAQGAIGPNLTHIYTEAANALASQLYKDSKGVASTPREFLRESILKPSAYVCPNCPSGPCPDHVMPKDFKSRLTPEELETILDMLVTFE